jgi:phage shock protein PspC (stress-responsive transcriptional regulator)
MRKFEQLMQTYFEAYMLVENKLLRIIFSLLVFFGFLGLVYAIPLYRLFLDILEPSVTKHINLATPLVLILTFYYFSLSWRLGLSMFFPGFLALALIHIIELSVSVPLWIVMAVIFFVSWLVLNSLQNRFSNPNRPSHESLSKLDRIFFEIKIILLAPAWVLSQLFRIK